MKILNVFFAFNFLVTLMICQNNLAEARVIVESTCTPINYNMKLRVLDSHKKKLSDFSVHFFANEQNYSNPLIKTSNSNWKLTYHPKRIKNCLPPNYITLLFFKKGYHTKRVKIKNLKNDLKLLDVFLIKIGSNYKSQNIKYTGAFTDVEHVLKQIDKSLEKKMHDQSKDRKGMQPGETIRN